MWKQLLPLLKPSVNTIALSFLLYTSNVMVVHFWPKFPTIPIQIVLCTNPTFSTYLGIKMSQFPVSSMTNNISLSKQVHLGTINTRQGPNRQHWIEHMRRELTHFTFLANYQYMIYHTSGAANDLNFHWIGKLGL